MALKYFGTDGIRGRFGGKPLTIEFALRVGNAIAGSLVPSGGLVVIGRDTRISGDAIEAAISAGLQAGGVSVQLAGVIPTPGVAHVTKKYRADLGIVVSASHNPYYDNGIKFFNSQGGKLNDEQQQAIETALENDIKTNLNEDIGRCSVLFTASTDYRNFVEDSIARLELDDMKIVVDAGNGAMYRIAPQMFEAKGAKVFSIGTEPNGTNINEECGSTHTKALQREVVKRKAHVGFAFDGDGDRLVAVDQRGKTIDGDDILYILATYAQSKDLLKGPVVGTSMTNLGLENALKAQNIGFERARVGDKHVLEKLNATGGTIGGESSGHIILLDHATTGDGLMAAAQLVKVMKATGKTLTELKAGFKKYPQVLINVKVNNKRKALESSQTESAIRTAQKKLGQNGRIVLRPSGTEPVVRVMVEGEDASITKELAESIAETIGNLNV